jgi:hypothetical protein
MPVPNHPAVDPNGLRHPAVGNQLVEFGNAKPDIVRRLHAIEATRRDVETSAQARHEVRSAKVAERQCGLRPICGLQVSQDASDVDFDGSFAEP